MGQKDEFLRYFRETQPKFSRFYACILNRMDLTISQYALLNHLAVTGEVPMTAISCNNYISKPAVTNLVDRLEQKKLIKRIPHPKDRRIHLLHIQAKGKKVINEIQSQVLKFLLEPFDQLTPAERKSLIRFYALISKTMDEALSLNTGKNK